MRSLHVCVTSVQFGKKPEGICTERLVRALLDHGHRVTVLTSTKEGSSLEHPRLNKVVFPHRPRYPRGCFKLWARLERGIYSNFYLWSKRAAAYDFGNDLPDVIYGRSWPHASLVPAYMLAQRLDLPLMLHFSDPFPPPTEKVPVDTPFFSDLQRMVSAASAITFTNEETIAYQRRFIEFEPDRAHVLNHVGPDPMVFGKPGERGTYYHVGSVGPTRSPVPLIEGFALHVEKAPEARFYFVGANPKYVEPEIERGGLERNIQVLPFASDVRSVYEKAGVLISLDAMVEEAVFTPTKIVEYLFTDRPVLAITPKGSPVEKLVGRTPETACAVTRYDPESISKGIDRISVQKWDEQDYRKRLEKMDDFSAAAVACKFDTIFNEATAAGCVNR